MQQLERSATSILQKGTDQSFVEFLVQITFLKQPYKIDRKEVSRRLLECQDDVKVAREALSDIGRLDYHILEILGRLPYFGRHGGRSFASAVLRIVKPTQFGIIDWRNLAVLCGSPGFDGLVDPPATLTGVDRKSIIQRKGTLEFTSDLYREYNVHLTQIARACSVARVADIDLALWTYSIERSPFIGRGPTLFETIWTLSDSDRLTLRSGLTRYTFISTNVNGYIAGLHEIGTLSRERVQAELRAIFSFVKHECTLWSFSHPYAVREVIHTVRALDEAIESSADNRLLEKWRRWEGMVDPSSYRYRGVCMPASMIVDGYVVFEDLVPIREHFESLYEDGTFAPKYDAIED